MENISWTKKVSKLKRLEMIVSLKSMSKVKLEMKLSSKYSLKIDIIK